jgi:hypothetical protein
VATSEGVHTSQCEIAEPADGSLWLARASPPLTASPERSNLFRDVPTV